MNNESKILNKQEEQDAAKDLAFEQLLQIAEILRSMGLDVIDRLIKKEYMHHAGTPLVSDGLDGIRFSYNRVNGLRIWFTNGFENWDDSKRVEVVKKISEAGLGAHVVGGYEIEK